MTNLPRCSMLASLVIVMLLAGPAQCTLFLFPNYVASSTSTSLPVTATSAYDPTTKDWASVVSACLTAGQQEKRLFNFFTRASFHDAMAVPTIACSSCPRGGAGEPVTGRVMSLRRHATCGAVRDDVPKWSARDAVLL
jgi:hypothetical protein